MVENKAGGGTNIGNAYVAHADPDGYTVLYGTSSLAVNDTLYRSLDYNPNTDLAPVSMVAKFPFFMFVPNSSPAKTVAEFIAYVKAHPGKLVMGSPGTGSAPHLTAELFLQMAGLQMTHVPYRGAAPAFIDLIPGRIDCYFGSGELLTYSRSGQVRCLATTGTKRASAAPDIPDHRRVRTAQLRRRFLARCVLAGKNIAGARAEIERRYRRGARAARGHRTAGTNRLCGKRFVARRAARFFKNGFREMECRDQDSRNLDRAVSDVSPWPSRG